MFYSIVLCCLVCVYAAPPPTEVVPLEKQQPTVIPIVSQSEELEPNGTYKYSYETGNGIKREEISYDKVVPKVQGRSASSNEGGESGESDEIHVQQGSYSYTAPDGTLISVRYIADENGFQPIGDHIPRVAPVTQSASGSAEKSGRSLKVKDNSEAASVPAVVARSGVVTKPEEPSTKSETTSKPLSSEASVASNESESSQPEVTPTTSSSSESEASTTAAVSETTKSPEATTASEVAESSTTAAPSSSETTESSSTASSAESSTTEASSTVSA